MRRRLGAHRLRRRQACRPPHRPRHAQQCGQRADPQGQPQRRVVQPELEFGEAEEVGVKPHQPVPQPAAAGGAQDCAQQHHHQRELQVVPGHGAVAETEGLEDGDLLPLQVQQARKDGVGHERRHAQEHHRETHRERPQHADFVRDADVRGVIGPAVSAAAAVGFEQPVHRGDDRLLGRVRLEGEGRVVEGVLEIKRRRHLAVGHPEDAVGAIVRQGRAGPRFKDVFGGEHDARHPQRLPPTV